MLLLQTLSKTQQQVYNWLHRAGLGETAQLFVVDHGYNTVSRFVPKNGNVNALYQEIKSKVPLSDAQLSRLEVGLSRYTVNTFG
jgi:hypothetical protein